VGGTVHRVGPGRPGVLVGDDGGVLRSLRGPDGGPSKGVRLLAVLLALALLGGAATSLFPVLRWLADVL
jgi:hypothetical protein